MESRLPNKRYDYENVLPLSFMRSPFGSKMSPCVNPRLFILFDGLECVYYLITRKVQILSLHNRV